MFTEVRYKNILEVSAQTLLPHNSKSASNCTTSKNEYKISSPSYIKSQINSFIVQLATCVQYL